MTTYAVFIMTLQNDSASFHYEFALSEISSLAPSLISFAENYSIWLFYGEMGSGKTTLIKEVCRQMGVRDDISSPTFSIVNEYAVAENTIYHFDLYRLKNERELLDIGFEEYLDSGAYCFIEWPEKALPFLPQHFLEIKLENTATHTRFLQAKHVSHKP